LNGISHSFRKERAKCHTCLEFNQVVLLNTRLFLLIHRVQKTVEETRLKYKNFLLQSHLVAMDSKSVTTFQED
jgi:hypothetical protein